MNRKTSIIGMRFGRLLVKNATDERKSGRILYECLCDCGNVKLTTRWQLVNGNTKSCGCIRKERPNRLDHGMSNSREYKIWADMHKRCENPNQKTFNYYGGRGIKVCERWNDFRNFYLDMGKCPESFTLDRLDCDGDYEPSNCRWASMKEQSRNRRSNHMITFNGKTQCLTAWAEETGITRGALKQRIKRNWSIEKALTTKQNNI